MKWTVEDKNLNNQNVTVVKLFLLFTLVFMLVFLASRAAYCVHVMLCDWAKHSGYEWCLQGPSCVYVYKAATHSNHHWLHAHTVIQSYSPHQPSLSCFMILPATCFCENKYININNIIFFLFKHKGETPSSLSPLLISRTMSSWY